MSLTQVAAEAVLFDLDDTLLDHKTAAAQATRWLAQYIGRNPDELVALWREAVQVHYDRWLAGELTYDQMVHARLRHAIDPHLDMASALALFTRYFEVYRSSWQAFPDTLACLKDLTPLKLGIITNGRDTEQLEKLQTLGLTDYFSVVSVCRVGCFKPDPVLFHEACHQLGVSPERVVCVGDSFRVDYQGAVNAGLQALWLNRAGAAADRQPGEIRSLAEVPVLLHR